MTWKRETQERQDREDTTLPVTGAFIAIGMVPNTAWLKDLLPLDEWGFILTNDDHGNRHPGHFRRGGRALQTRSGRSAPPWGTAPMAAIAVERYLEGIKKG